MSSEIDARMAALNALHGQVVAAAKSLLDAVSAFDAAALDLTCISVPGLSWADLPSAPSAVAILAACAARPPQDKAAEAIDRAGKTLGGALETFTRGLNVALSAARRREGGGSPGLPQ